MVDALTLSLVEQELVTKGVSLSVGYAQKPWAHSKTTKIPSTRGSKQLKNFTDTYEDLWLIVERLYKKTTRQDLLLRKLSLSVEQLIPKKEAPSYDSLFSKEEKSRDYVARKTILAIKEKFGENALLRGINFEENATTRFRNSLVGGHAGGEDHEIKTTIPHGQSKTS